MKIYIKNMVCDRCRLAVIAVLKQLNLEYASVTLGAVDFAHFQGVELTEANQNKLQNALENLGFSLLSDNKNKLIEQIKHACLLYLQQDIEYEKQTLSYYISQYAQRDYSYLSSLFSAVEGLTIESYFIRLRVEKVKELLIYEELSLGEISFQLRYSSVAHLSGQFKKVTGLTITQFRQSSKSYVRSPLDNL